MRELRRTHKSSGMHWVGNGFPVQSVFSYDNLGAELDPFLLLDYAAPYEFEPGIEKRGVGAHPHRGFETVTLAFQGEVAHRDSSGGGGVIGPGDVQWMTAGAGLLHEEFHTEGFTKRGGVFQMAQLWVNLPAKDKSTPPRYQGFLKEQIPSIPLPGDAGRLRVISGGFGGVSGPAETFTPVTLWEIHQDAGTSVVLPAEAGHTLSLFVMDGRIRTDGTYVSSGTLALFDREGQEIEISAVQNSHLLLMGGEPIGEPIVGQGPFVMNSHKEILRAYKDFHDGSMGVID